VIVGDHLLVVDPLAEDRVGQADLVDVAGHHEDVVAGLVVGGLVVSTVFTLVLIPDAILLR